jgi:hypothetical protein
MGIDGQEQICDETAEYLSNQSIRASGDHMIDIEVLLPPSEEFLDVPAK